MWLERYKQGGIEGLKNLSGRGRKPILEEADLEKVKEVVAEHQQKLSMAREELEHALGKSLSQDTLKRFVKKTLAAIRESSWTQRHPKGAYPPKTSPQRAVSAPLCAQNRRTSLARAPKRLRLARLGLN